MKRILRYQQRHCVFQFNSTLCNFIRLFRICQLQPSTDSIFVNLGKLTQLTALGINENSLTSIPNEIGELKALTLLDLRYNKLTEVPKEIGNLSKLQKLYLRFNKLEELPEELGKLEQFFAYHICNTHTHLIDLFCS